MSDWKGLTQQKPEDKQRLLEQYRIIVETTTHVSGWRQTANNLWLTIHTLLLGSFAFLMQSSISSRPLFITAGLSGIALAFCWFATIRYYARLNKAKFTVISELEKQLGCSPFTAEWVYLGEHKQGLAAWTVTRFESIMPWIFAASEAAVMAYLLGR